MTENNEKTVDTENGAETAAEEVKEAAAEEAATEEKSGKTDKKKTKKHDEELKKKVYDGADLYISSDSAVLCGYESLTGLKVIDSYSYRESFESVIDGKSIAFSRSRTATLEPTKAEVLAYDNKNNPFISVNQYGKGRVFFVNAPIESNLIEKHNAFDSK